MTTGSSWRAFALGIRWGCGHSIGLIFMALIFFAAGQRVDLDQVGGYLNYAVGFFMIVLGLWTAFHVRKKYRAQLKEGVPPSLVGEIEDGQIESSPVSQRNSSATPTNLVELMPLSQRRLSSICSDAPPHVSILSAKECTGVETSASPSTSFQALKQEEGGLLTPARWSHDEDIAKGGTVASSSFYPRNWMCCQCVDFDKPTTQKAYYPPLC
uniref:Uncharacterized protein n=1 Tax=Hyaloperonospora arabidopsidis (strain Emoy2) TaxID=559515 RepID=M4BCT2_HYAAE